MNDKLTCRIIDSDIAKAIIKKNHYSHTIMFGVMLSVGVFKKLGDNPFFENVEDDKLMGCICYSRPVGCNTHLSISPLVTGQTEILELTRLWIADDPDCGKNTESWLIGQSIDLIKKHHPEIKVLISYSDTAQGHNGTIYQATNWIYQGVRDCAGGSLFSWDEGKTWNHFKSCATKFGVTNYKDMYKHFPVNTLVKLPSKKHRYIMPMGDRRFKKELIKTLKFPIVKEYPKNGAKIRQDPVCIKKLVDMEPVVNEFFYESEE